MRLMSEGSSLRGRIYASMFGALTAVGAYIVVPVPPVPVTMQTFFLYLAACLLGGPLGAWSQAVYVLIGAVGLPVFAAGKGGLGVLLGPTGGYLIGFIVGAYVTGRLAQGGKPAGSVRLLLAMAAGTVCLYALGVAQLMLVARLSPAKALAVGVLPFLPGDAAKMAAAVFVVWILRNQPPFRGGFR